MTKHVFWAILIGLMVPSFPLFAEGIIVSKTSGSNSFSLVSNSTAAQIVIDSHDAELVSRDANNKDGNNVCRYKSTPMLEDFELYQNIGGLPAGKYTVHCKMAVPNGKLTTQRLFANNNIQYYGYSTDYNANIANGETYGCAGLETVGSNPYNLQEMEVNVVLTQGLQIAVVSVRGEQDICKVLVR